jgi:hypothetical protein
MGLIGYNYNFCFPLSITLAILVCALWIDEEYDGNSKQIMDMTLAKRFSFNFKAVR